MARTSEKCFGHQPSNLCRGCGAKNETGSMDDRLTIDPQFKFTYYQNKALVSEQAEMAQLLTVVLSVGVELYPLADDSPTTALELECAAGKTETIDAWVFFAALKLHHALVIFLYNVDVDLALPVFPVRGVSKVQSVWN